MSCLYSLRQKRVPKFSLIFYDSTNNYFFKHQNKVIFVIKLLNPRTWLTLKNSLVIFLASDTYAASLTSAVSETSMALQVLFPVKNFLILMITSTLALSNTGSSLWIGSLKNQIFTDTYLVIFLSEAEYAATFLKKNHVNFWWSYGTSKCVTLR